MSIAIKASYEICLKIQMAQIEPVDSNVLILGAKIQSQIPTPLILNLKVSKIKLE